MAQILRASAGRSSFGGPPPLCQHSCIRHPICSRAIHMLTTPKGLPAPDLSSEPQARTPNPCLASPRGCLAAAPVSRAPEGLTWPVPCPPGSNTLLHKRPKHPPHCSCQRPKIHPDSPWSRAPTSSQTQIPPNELPSPHRLTATALVQLLQHLGQGSLSRPRLRPTFSLTLLSYRPQWLPFC